MTNPDRMEDTTTILEKVAPGFAWLPRVLRKHLTPRVVWTLAGALWTFAVAWGSVCLTIHVRSISVEKDVSQLKDSAKRFEEQRATLEAIDKKLAVLDSKVDNISAEVEHQREWRDRIEQQAEAPPHARWKR